MGKVKEDANAEILAEIKKLGDRLDVLEKPVVKEVVSKGQHPIPIEYRHTVDTILNNRFGIELEYLPDGAAFQFSVLVPEEYSNAAKPHWETYKEDRRSKVISNALGVNGVREWATLIYENLGMETKARITHDRALL